MRLRQRPRSCSCWTRSTRQYENMVSHRSPSSQRPARTGKTPQIEQDWGLCQREPAWRQRDGTTLQGEFRRAAKLFAWGRAKACCSRGRIRRSPLGVHPSIHAPYRSCWARTSAYRGWTSMSGLQGSPYRFNVLAINIHHASQIGCASSIKSLLSRNMANQDCLASSTAQSRPCPEPSLAGSQQLAVQCMQVSVASPRRAGPCDWQQNALKAPTPHARACTRMLPSDRNRVPSQDPLAGLQTGRTCSCARLQAKYARHSRRAAGRGQTITAQGRTPYQQCQAHPINSLPSAPAHVRTMG